jgi:hypothetical protein
MGLLTVTPNSCNNAVLWCNQVTCRSLKAETPGTLREDFANDAWRDSWEVNSRLGFPYWNFSAKPPSSYSCSPIGRGGCLKNSLCVGSIPTRSTKYAAVAQLAEVLVLETRGCGFNSHQQYQTCSRGETEDALDRGSSILQVRLLSRVPTIGV